MLTSRGLNILRAIRQASRINKSQSLIQVRNSHECVYRLPAPKTERKYFIITEILGGIAWWWVLWHLWHEHEHITGEFEYPDPSKWTDAELGIPPDDVDV